MADNRHYTALSVAVAAALASMSLASAEEADDKTQAKSRIEEVVTTAERREESIQDVSLSVTALGAELIDRGGIEDVSRLEHLVPGMRFGQSGNEVRLAMRGTRTNNVGSEAEQVVGIFEDGVYVPTTTQALGAYVDIKRIEVLRGPQGTLYGRNTFGGTINVITNEPMFDGFDAHVQALYGDYDRTRFEGMLNLPVSDNFAIRVAALSDVHDGYIINTNQPGEGDDLHDQDQQYGRISARWQPNDRIDATLRVALSTKESNGSAIWGYQQIGGYLDGAFAPGHLYAPDDASGSFDQGPWTVSRDFASFANLDSTSTTLTVNWDLEFATLKWVHNVTDFDGEQMSDFDYSDGGDPLNSGFGGWVSKQDTWSTELQLVSNSVGDLSWLTGLYFYEQEAGWNWLERVDGVNGIPHWDNTGDYTSDSLGVFGQLKYAVSDQTRLIGGLRYAEDSKQQRDQLDWSVFPPVGIPGSGDQGEWDKWLYKLGYEHDVSDGVMTYANLSTGYRAGGINFVAERVPLTYEPEEVTAYEAGVKSTFAGGSAQLNVAAYLNKYRDMHAQSFIFLPGSTAVSEFTENGGEVDAAGIEAELKWRPDDYWKVDASVALMDAEFGEYNVSNVAGLGSLGGRQDPDGTNPLLSLRGWTPALSPDFTMGVRLSRDFPLANGAYITPYLQSTYTGKYAAADINVPGVFQDAYTKSDFRLIWNNAKGNIEVQGFILNIEDEPVLNRVVVFNPGARPELASLQANWNNPRTWGLSFSMDFE